MSIKDYFSIALTNVLRSKKKIFYIIIMIFCSLLIFVITFFTHNFRNLYGNDIEKDTSFRTFYVSPIVNLPPGEERLKRAEEAMGKAIQKLSNIKHVQYIYNNDYNSFYVDGSSFKDDNLDGKMTLLNGSPNLLPNVIAGRTFRENERSVAICPINFYPNTLTQDFFPDISKSNIIDGKKILGETFTVYYDVYEEKPDSQGFSIKSKEQMTESFKIVGLYSSEKHMNQNDVCYIPEQDIIKLCHNQNFVCRENNGNPYGGVSLVLLVDNINNIETVKTLAAKLGYDLEDVVSMDERTINNLNFINITAMVILGIVLFVVMILTFSYIRKKILNETKIIGILRACGYTKKDIKNIYLLEIVITNTFSYLVGLIIFLVIYFILNETIFAGLIYIGVSISLNLLTLLLSLVAIILVSTLIVCFGISKKMQSNIVSLIGSEE
jgi:ABC-type antimicrobial peptide transport system permease subunit